MQTSGSNRTVLIVAGVLAGICLCVCVIGGAFFAITGGGLAALFGAVAAPATAGGQFLTAVKNGDFDAAYDLMDPGLQADFGSPDALAEQLAGDGVLVEDYSITNTQLDNNAATLAGVLVLEDGGRTDFELELNNRDGVWRVTEFFYAAP